MISTKLGNLTESPVHLIPTLPGIQVPPKAPSSQGYQPTKGQDPISILHKHSLPIPRVLTLGKAHQELATTQLQGISSQVLIVNGTSAPGGSISQEAWSSMLSGACPFLHHITFSTTGHNPYGQLLSLPVDNNQQSRGLCCQGLACVKTEAFGTHLNAYI